jgi:hypothetical protein
MNEKRKTLPAGRWRYKDCLAFQSGQRLKSNQIHVNNGTVETVPYKD